MTIFRIKNIFIIFILFSFLISFTSCSSISSFFSSISPTRLFSSSKTGKEDVFRGKAQEKAYRWTTPLPGPAMKAKKALKKLPPLPGSHLKKKILVVNFETDFTASKMHLGEICSKKLIYNLNKSGKAICFSPEMFFDYLNRSKISALMISKKENIKKLYKDLGIHLVITGKVEGVETKKIRKGTSTTTSTVATAWLTIRVIDSTTGNIVSIFTQQNPFFLTMEKGEFPDEKAILNAIDYSIEEVIPDIINEFDQIPWFAFIVKIEKGHLYINAGRKTGLKQGDILSVYKEGKEIVHPITGVSIGREEGTYKGKIRLTGFVGEDGAVCVRYSGKGFALNDIVRY